ncbi:unnamed protein product [Rhizoctonia solani]|uniref:Uncharacterized protein n=1 Tax=Rhizoctonia solani TaxID=456999 RepID=A0A8H3D2J5_9AGAM|nr:unnamed protein product [Rhizoctonia solani]
MAHSPPYCTEPSTGGQRKNDTTIVVYNKPLPTAFGFGVGRGSPEEDKEFEENPDERPPVKPLVELEMTQLSAELRRKPFWWTKCHDETILNKWREEALAQAKLMKESHVDYVLEELVGYANLRDDKSGAEVSCHDKIWQSDTLVPASLKKQLVTGAIKLEDVPESEKDWHPRSNGQVLDLVHPSLYPIVYGRTLSYPEDSDDRSLSALQLRLKPPQEKSARLYWEPSGDYYISKRFQWLPTDFEVSEDGASVRSLSYINNLNPIKHQSLCKAIDGLIAAFIPLFERVLTDSIPKNKAVPQRTYNGYSYDRQAYRRSPDFLAYTDDQNFEEDHQEWANGRIFITPRIPEGGYSIGSLEKRPIKYKLAGRIIQVIVKLANIHLTPENPEYSGGSWHVEGMKNEAIAASGIYYYDEENITESRLAFRTAVAPPYRYEQDDERGCMLTWGMRREDPCVNELGSVITRQDRCIAFPNTYQHRVSPFELVDKSKPGHRKIVALFLVDPAVRRPSTTTVPPQQAEWRASGISGNQILKSTLPPEIINYVDSMVEGAMTRQEAEAYRLELMDERKAFVATNDEEFFMVPFALCEH